MKTLLALSITIHCLKPQNFLNEAQDLPLGNPHVSCDAGKYCGLEEEAPSAQPFASTFQLGALSHTTLDEFQDLVLFLINLGSLLSGGVKRTPYYVPLGPSMLLLRNSS